MEYVALVTLLLLIQFMWFMMQVGVARGKDDVQAPACSGGENFERANRVHMNTLEQLMMVLPAMWVCAHFFRADVAAILGAIFLVSRFIYSTAYRKDPKSRAIGFSLGFLATAGLILSALYGVVMSII